VIFQNVHLFLPATPFSSVGRDCSPVDLLLRFDDERREREISWDDLVDEAMLKPILDLDGPKKWLRLQATGLMSSERKLEKRSIISEVEKIHSSGTAATFNLMDENYKSNLHPISYNCTVGINDYLSLF
jgi:hypothetical protein